MTISQTSSPPETDAEVAAYRSLARSLGEDR